MCKSKIHRAVVTEANVAYEGSITIDADLMKAADLLPYERVQVANICTGARLETYVITGKAGTGVIGMNGAAALLAKVNDEVHIISYAFMEADEILHHRPKIVHVDKKNRLPHD